MSQLDWVIDAQSHLAPGEAVVSFVNSGDIDAVIIHIFVFIQNVEEE